jgi:hypothetical protein
MNLKIVMTLFGQSNCFFLVTGSLWRWLWELRLQIPIFFVYIVNVQKNYAPI